MRRFIDSFIKKVPAMAVAAICISALLFQTVYASSGIDEARDDRDEAQQNEEEAQDVLDSLEEQLDDAIAYVAELDARITDIQSQITQNENEEEQLQAEIDLTNVELAEARVEENQQYAAMMARIQYLYEEGDIEYLDTLMSSISFSDMLNQSEYVSQISEYDQEQLNALIATRQDIEDYEALLETDMAELESVRAELESQKKDLEDVAEAKNEEISRFENDIVAQQALVDRYAADREAAEARIAQFNQASIQNQQSGGQEIYDASGYEGKFMWPSVEGTYISSYFGPRSSPGPGASTYHKGIDIPCSTGSDVVAAESGTVVISQYSNSAGNYIMIDHGNGVSTVYMHNSQLLVGVGTTVTKGQVIAKAGNTGNSFGSHCHFGVMINGEYVNPLDYL